MGSDMAGTIGVGSALRRAREIRGITIDEAARDTKLRGEQLYALEGEAFDDLGDPVYARAMLRTYAQYLGLKPERVLSVYAKHAEEVEPPPPPGKLGRVERGLAASRIRDNQKFLLIAAAVVLVALIGGGAGVARRRAAAGDDRDAGDHRRARRARRRPPASTSPSWPRRRSRSPP